MTNRTLLLLPGMDGTGELFADFVRALPSHLVGHVVSYPRNQFLPYSELSVLVTEAARPFDKVVLVAESFSTPLAIEFAATHAEQVTALVLCAGFASSPIGSWIRYFRPLFKSAFALPPSTFLTKSFLLARDASHARVQSVHQAIRSVHPAVLAQRLVAVTECDVKEQLRRVNAPILYLQGAHDRLVGALSAAEIKRLKPETVLEQIAAPHLVLQSNPAEAAQRISAFLARIGMTRQ